MREYELTYLVSDEVLESDLNRVTGKISDIILNAGGKIKKEEIWGRRKLAYPIRKQNFANYVTLWIELPANQLANINRELQIMSQILRHLLIIKSISEKQLKVTKEDVVANEELEKIIGDKSAEIIAGETEESYGLMAKRDSGEKDAETKSEIEEIGKDKTEPTKKEEVTKEKIKIRQQPEIKEEKIEEAGTVKEEDVEKKVKKTKVAKAKKVAEKPVEKEEDEADRIKKLDEKLDELLGDDL
jgi:small subunit ribosomal protein S6